MHFVYGKDDSYYFLTKTDTQKAINLAKNPHVAFTIHRSSSLKVLYIRGEMTRVEEKTDFDTVYTSIATAHEYLEGMKFAPITKLDKGSYLVFKLTPTDTKLLDYITTSW